ncbi:MAG: hypothetical protein HZA50_07425 [Planctomycetes bacterium]|nr:hypothetical protein [Planctomycetota bacterium]
MCGKKSLSPDFANDSSNNLAKPEASSDKSVARKTLGWAWFFFRKHKYPAENCRLDCSTIQFHLPWRGQEFETFLMTSDPGFRFVRLAADSPHPGLLSSGPAGLEPGGAESARNTEAGATIRLPSASGFANSSGEALAKMEAAPDKSFRDGAAFSRSDRLTEWTCPTQHLGNTQPCFWDENLEKENLT